MKELVKNLEEAVSLKLDKSKWKRFKFSELAQNIVEKITPKDSSLSHYIGLEHLDSGSLKILRFGDPNALEGDKLKIHKGDVIFAKRNAYLKRAAVAEFDAIASAHSMVLRAIPENVAPEFFPFLLFSDTFWDQAIRISVGSLSPTINWKSLAKQEFLLPPKDQQACLAELLWAGDEVVTTIESCSKYLESLKDRISSKYFTEGAGADTTKSFGSYRIPQSWDIEPIIRVASVEYGISESVANNKDSNIGWPILTGANITLGGKLDTQKKVYIEAPSKERFTLKKGDLMFNWRSGSPEHVGKTALFDLEGSYTYASFILRVRCGERLLNRFAYHLLNYLRKIEYFTKDMAQQVNFKMNASVFRQVLIPIPTLLEQAEIAHRIDLIENQIEEFERHREKATQLQKVLINQIF